MVQELGAASPPAASRGQRRVAVTRSLHRSRRPAGAGRLVAGRRAPGVGRLLHRERRGISMIARICIELSRSFVSDVRRGRGAARCAGVTLHQRGAHCTRGHTSDAPILFQAAGTVVQLARAGRGRRDGGTAGRRDGGTAGRRDGGTAGRRDGGTAGRHSHRWTPAWLVRGAPHPRGDSCRGGRAPQPTSRSTLYGARRAATRSVPCDACLCLVRGSPRRRVVRHRGTGYAHRKGGVPRRRADDGGSQG